MNGSGGADSTGVSSERLNVNQIHNALQTIYEPRTSNEQRHNATTFLETIKTNPAAPSYGFDLAKDASQSAIARHYGLSLLEHAIRYRLDDFTGQECGAIRAWVIELAENIDESEPLFLRSKVARLWVDLAERTWGLDWLDMDESLCKLWQGSYVHQELVLYVLETLADEVFNTETSGAASLRSNELGKNCVEIYTAAAVLSRVFPERETPVSLRHGEEGWFTRLLELLERCLNEDIQLNSQAKTCSGKILAVLQTTVPWIILRQVADTTFLALISRCLQAPDVTIQMAAVEVLHSLYHRAPWPEESITILACPVLSTDGLGLLTRFYESACGTSDDIDDEKYTMLKKFAEMVCALGAFWESRPKVITEKCDTSGILKLFVGMMQNPSLVVSIPIVYLWTRLLSVSEVTNSSDIMQIVGPLLEVCSQRLLRYENLPTQSTDQTLAFLHEDFDTMPERHAFVGNYRRFCATVIEKIVRRVPFDAIQHILSQADSIIQNLYSDEPQFSPERFTVNSAPVLRLDAQATVVMTALRSYQKWIAVQRARGKDHAEKASTFESAVSQWTKDLLQKDFPDPVIRKRVFQLVVEIATLGLTTAPDLGLTICTACFEAPTFNLTDTNPSYDDAVKDLQASYPRELQKLAPIYCDDYFAGWNLVAGYVHKKTQDQSLDERVRLDYQAFLFMIIQRTAKLSAEDRYERLDSMLRPVVEAWQDQQVGAALHDFESFLKVLHLEHFPHVFLNHGATRIGDWSAEPLNTEEFELRSKISDNIDAIPLQATRSLLSVSTERLRPGSSTFRAAQVLWREAVPVVVPSLLRALSYSHAFANPETWSAYPPEMQIVVGRILIDRVWQSGISNETKDDFYNRVRNSRSSLEGMASAVRSAIRGVREVSYWILHCMTILGDILYCHDDLAEVLAKALYENARFLSPNQLMSLLKLSTALIDGCPAQYRTTFLPPILTALFRELDFKVTSEWEKLIQRGESSASDDVLDQEMKAESILRHLTHSCVALVQQLVMKKDPTATSKDPPNGTSNGTNGPAITNGAPVSPELRALTVNNPAVLEAIVSFCNHALRMRDSRCCSTITRVLRSLIPEFAE
jgi:exportin-5